MTPMAPGSATPHVTSAINGRALRPESDLRKKAHARLAERIDPQRSRHKPLSLLRTEARRLSEQFCDLEAPTMTRSERDRFIDDVMAESLSFGPLEELFRDDAVKEILILAPTQIISRKAESWLPTSARFRDADQVRAVLQRYLEIGEALVAGPATQGGFDVKLPNQFRVMAMLPPSVMEQSPTAVLIRMSGAGSTAVATPLPGSSSGTVSMVPPAASPSGTLSNSARMAAPPSSGTVKYSPPAQPVAAAPTPVNIRATPVPPEPGSSSDPLGKLKQRLTERIIMKFAAAGVYDINQFPIAELRKIVHANVVEFCTAERLGFDDKFHERLALEILAGMNR